MATAGSASAATTGKSPGSTSVTVSTPSRTSPTSSGSSGTIRPSNTSGSVTVSVPKVYRPAGTTGPTANRTFSVKGPDGKTAAVSIQVPKRNYTSGVNATKTGKSFLDNLSRSRNGSGMVGVVRAQHYYSNNPTYIFDYANPWSSMYTTNLYWQAEYANAMAGPVMPTTQDAANGVHDIQTMLFELGYMQHLHDHGIDQDTINALKAFQRDAGLPQTGFPDEGTVNALADATHPDQASHHNINALEIAGIVVISLVVGGVAVKAIGSWPKSGRRREDEEGTGWERA
jgi:hypothetical protein